MQKDKMTEETVQAEEQLQDQSSDAVQESQVQEQTSKTDVNWEQAREVMKLQKQEIDQLKAELGEMKQPKQQETDEFDQLDPDDVLTIGKFKELSKKLTAKESAQTAQQVVGEYIQQQRMIQNEQNMREKHDDYDYVIEHFAVPIIKNDPALAYKIQTSKNPAETAYRLGKLSDEYGETSMKKQTSPKAEKVIKNASRPVSSNAVSSNLQSQADDFSKMSPAQVWEMSQKYARKA